MKKFFIQLFLAVAAGIADNAAGVVAPTSELLTKLKAEKKALWAEMIKHEDPDSKEALDAKLAVWKKDGEIKAEVQAIEKAANDAKIAEARNLRLQLNVAQFAAYDNLLAAKAKKGATPEQIAEAQTAFDTAKELVDNELLAKYAASKSAKPKAEGDETSETKSANKAAILELYRSGKKHSEIEEAGYPRSTVWHVIDKAIKAGEVAKLH